MVSALGNYSVSLFWGDLSAGLIVGIVALPLAIAFAIASGVSPDRGLTTAIIAGFLISVFGGSRVQIGGPTGAFVVIVYQIVQFYGVDGLMIATVMAGVILILMGCLRMGAIIRFIPYPLTVGFTSGIAVVIFSSQIGDFFGFKTGTLPADFMEKWQVYLETFRSLNLVTLSLSLFSIALLVFWPRLNRKIPIPGSIIVILVVTALVQVFHLPVETIGSRFSSLPAALPSPQWPAFSFVQMKNLIGPAFTIALLGAVESLLSATVSDGMIEGRHRSNTELIAQGVANVVVPFFGGIPATGAIARTATNVKNGGRTPVAGMIHAATLLVIVLLFGHWARLIPLCVLAAILVIVSYHMSEWRAFKALLRGPRMDLAVLLTTFLLTVFVDLTVAVEVGMLLSLILFMKRMTDVTSVREVKEALDDDLDETDLREAEDATSQRTIPEGVDVYEAEGAFFFGVSELFRDMMEIGKNPSPVMILRMRHVLLLDATGLRALKDLRKQCLRYKVHLILCGIHAQPLMAMEQSGLLAEFGEKNVLGSLDEALEEASKVSLIK
ncbi:MAG: STAS domain-containing protein [Deltaproteobacteria bacterium]|nr:STAS domain-containing protein [Deltaproteobacteria bacterium]